MTGQAEDESVGELGDSVPEPLGFNAFWPECLSTLESTGAEDRAPQGCDPSAASSAGMAGRLHPPPQNETNKTRRTLAYCGQKMVLTMGSTLDY